MTDQCAAAPHSVAGREIAQYSAPPRRAAEARAAATAFVAQLNPAPSARAIQNLLLLSSELVTNAIQHAGSVTALSFKADNGALHVRVADPSPAHPQSRVPDMTGRTGGFGWPMILRLAHRVTVRPLGNEGKIILAVLAR
ncbi:MULTISPECIES: ATP-binding protein [unclassified Streptomyces]|uniref:ATP-binding protein n=1 Tax=unclassified Streptomyces TaxID=2593676 RepID=UPI002255068B|nr:MULTISPECIES: ATP-binding protein [unclassified Streptomyces]MCX5141010.1 ATP-binding protein [Streptomyces sp. NBC_00338]WRZ65506.1 ATP-binding protein [Streptomyces sp. NBC_01257]WSU59501.1 ATP-binding protein [Streptomyces sp. NBC_01104]